MDASSVARYAWFACSAHKKNLQEQATANAAMREKVWGRTASASVISAEV